MRDNPVRAAAFQQRLLPGERVVWSGAPIGGIALRPMDAFLVPFSLFWGGFAIFWNATVWLMPTPLVFKFFGLPFLVIGLYFIFGRFWLDALLQKRTSYALTSRRILIMRGGLWPVFKALDLRRLPALELRERKDGTGSIRFGAPTFPFGSGGLAIWSSAFDPTPQFGRIANVRNVYDIVQREADRREGVSS